MEISYQPELVAVNIVECYAQPDNKTSLLKRTTTKLSEEGEIELVLVLSHHPYGLWSSVQEDTLYAPRKNVNNKPSINSLIYNNVLPARYAILAHKACGNNQAIIDLT